MIAYSSILKVFNKAENNKITMNYVPQMRKFKGLTDRNMGGIFYKCALIGVFSLSKVKFISFISFIQTK